jgi:uncharacterized protein YjbI with pentapeptide repeats
MVTWRVPIIVALLGFVVLAGLAALASTAPGSAEFHDSLVGLKADELEAEKLRQEVVELQQANQAGSGPVGVLLSLGPLVTVLVGVVGLFATVWRQLDERERQRRQEARESEREEIRRFDENFAKVVENLGSDNAALQASAVISLTFLLTPEYARYHDRVLMLALATAKSGINYSDAVGRLFVDAIERAIRVHLAREDGEAPREALDLSRVRLDYIDLSGLDLTAADIAFASLHRANLIGAKFYRVRGFQVDLEEARLSRSDLTEARLNRAIAPAARFHDARCISIRLENAVLIDAQFQQAKLQEAHLEGADLRGARFEQANLNNAYMTGATFDDAALRSIATGALNWRQAHFDPEVMARLREFGDSARADPASAAAEPRAAEFVEEDE